MLRRNFIATAVASIPFLGNKVVEAKKPLTITAQIDIDESQFAKLQTWSPLLVQIANYKFMKVSGTQDQILDFHLIWQEKFYQDYKIDIDYQNLNIKLNSKNKDKLISRHYYVNDKVFREIFNYAIAKYHGLG